MMTTNSPITQGPIKAIHIQVPVGIPTSDGGLEIPNRVFLGGIPTETTELELELFFSDFGHVKDVRIVTDRVTGECKGFGFVTFDENEDISSLFRKKTIVMKGRKLRVRKAVRRNGSQFTSDNLSPEVSPLPKMSPHHLAPPSPPMSPVSAPGGQYIFIPNQHQPMPPSPPQNFGYQSCGMSPQSPVPYPTTSTYGIPSPMAPNNIPHQVYYGYPCASPIQIPVSWPIYQV